MHSNECTRVLFSYPPYPNPLPRLSKPVYPKSTEKRTRERLYRADQRSNIPQTNDQSQDWDEHGSQASNSGSSTAGHAQSSTPSSAKYRRRGDSVDSSCSSSNDGLEEESPTHGPGFAAQRGDGAEYTHFLGIEHSLLASSLIPGRKEMRDTKFELVMDHLAFIGHPVHLDRGRGKRATKAQDEEKLQQSASNQHQRHKSTHSAISPRLTPFSPAHLPSRNAPGSSRHASPALVPVPDSSSIPPSTPLLKARSLADVSHSSSTSASISQLQMSKTDSEPVSSNNSPMPPFALGSSVASLADMQLGPSAATPEEPPSATTTIDQSRMSSSVTSISRNSQALEAFNVVLVIDTPPDRHLSHHLNVYYQDIVLKLTAAIKYEELRDGWLSSEAATALRVRDVSRDQNRPLTGCIEGLVHCSSLCAALAEAFNAISNRKVARLTSLNRHIDIQLIVHDEVFDRNHSPTPDVHPAVAPTPGFLRPPGPAKDRLAQHQTLIPVEDPLAMQKELERSPPSDLPLMQFLEIMTPTLNFQEYAVLLDIEMNALQAMANHLIYWRKARLSNVVSLRNVYAPVSQLDVAGLPALAESYSRQFSALPPLVTILASLHRAKPFVEALQIPASTGRRSAYLNMLVWLLSKGLVAEVRVYYRLVANTEIKWRATQPERQTPQSNSRPASSCEDAPRGETDEPHSATTNVAESPSNSSLNLGALDSPARPMSFTHRQPSIPSDASEAPMETCRSPVPIPGHEGPRSAPSRTMSGVTSSASFRSQDPPPASEYSLTESSVIAEPGEPNSLEVKWLKLMTEGKSAEIQRRFERVRPFLNGRFDWEELLFRSGLTRREVKGVFEEMSEHLVIFHG